MCALVQERLKAASGPRTLWTRLMRLVNNDDFVSGLFVGVAAGVAISFYAQRRARTRSRRVITDSLHDKQAELDRLAHLLKHCLSMLLNSRFHIPLFHYFPLFFRFFSLSQLSFFCFRFSLF